MIEFTKSTFWDESLDVRGAHGKKVSELITALSKLDPNKQIVIYTTEWPAETISISERKEAYVLSPYPLEKMCEFSDNPKDKMTL